MNTCNIDTIGNILNESLKLNTIPLPLHEPSFSGNEWKYVKQCIDSSWVSSVGKYVDQFENSLCEFTGGQYAIAMVNGTAALHTCLIATKTMPDDEILVPSFTFVATSNAIKYCNATPHYVDIDAKTLCVDANKLAEYLQDNTTIENNICINKHTNKRINALIVMHTFGHPADLDALLNVCQRYHIHLIEDAAEAIGSQYKHVHCGTKGIVSALSFNGNKIITSGGGGAVLTNDKNIAQHIRHISTTAKLSHPWEYNHDEIGYNYRMPNINAALALAQLEQLPEKITRKRNLAMQYQELFKDVSDVITFKETSYAKSNYWLNILVTKDTRTLHALLESTHSAGILTRPAWKLNHQLSMYQSCPTMDLSVSKDMIQRILCLPSGDQVQLHV